MARPCIAPSRGLIELARGETSKTYLGPTCVHSSLVHSYARHCQCTAQGVHCDIAFQVLSVCLFQLSLIHI
eukprot:4791349-Alexandrium_andersonii.AAC.1